MSTTSYNTLFDHRLDADQKKQFIESQMMLAYKIVHKHYKKYTGPQAKTQQLLDDLISAAHFALVQSAKYFNIARQFSPTTYSTRSMENAVRSHLREIRTGGLIRNKRRRNRDSPKDPVVVQFDEANLTIDSIVSRYTDADSEACNDESIIEKAISVLTDEERDVIVSKYYHGESYSTIAGRDRRKRTRQRFKILEKSAIKKMRNLLNSEIKNETTVG